ncbi:SigB/SigF/SigG family RNA polymerase sigma factor [Spongiactinospora sp. TRM90649]|uniref:SigB/SigF/SigG family RNA polymerase sigma factor n=1 Tax=Spongiactinospora sp. TRM90649 TaxID=3031114 RepID=UPI0023F75CBC|nr:SigB/SigF/SigG family RNA polymerase sigma factor [Spongiactinospora sp. TRM90649]MDF5755864.1 SigB/SigF/SigG family RNA polymerase sigma factor [Spongiactinospora sp. TRM90649]
MAVHARDLTELTAEELLAEAAGPHIDPTHRERLRERIVEMHKPLAMEIARRYRYRGEPLEDLLQAAYVGLMKAVNGFDPDLGHAFRGYAVVTMTGEVKRHFRDRTWAIRVPRLYQERRSELNRLVADLSQELGRSPTVAELAVRMKITEEDVLLTLDASAAYSTLSLDAPLSTDDDAAALGDVIPEEGDELSSLVDREAVKPLIDRLPPREKKILLLRFFGNMTQAEIAAEFGISQMHVSRILRKVLDRLRGELLAGADRA